MTLAAHTSILTGLTPRRTGVHTNALTRLDSSIDTLATLLKADGYRTGAFVGAFVLDARFGLARGFDVYDDHVPLARSASFHVAERSAAEVVKLAGDWIVSQQSQPPTAPWLAWIHLFDPHAPYAAAVDCRGDGRSAYDAEVVAPIARSPFCWIGCARPTRSTGR
jgi:arylsulfatase A-like enzyme